MEDEPSNEKDGKEEENEAGNGGKQEDEQKDEEKADHVDKQDELPQQNEKSEEQIVEQDKPNTSDLDEALLAELEAVGLTPKFRFIQNLNFRRIDAVFFPAGVPEARPY